MLLMRQISGKSMLPAYRPGNIVVAWSRPARIVPGDVIIFRYDGMEKIKRVQAIKSDQLYLRGDHTAYSTDSRDFGWIHRSAVVGRVWLPRRRQRTYHK